MEQLPPKSVFDSYCLLSNDDKRAFIEMLARVSTAEVPFLIAREMPPPEVERFSDMVFKEITWQLFPLLQREARVLAREKPQMSDEDFDREFHDRIKASMENYNKEIAALERAKMKERRDRKSDPETVRRNVEICDRRKQNRKTWSIGKLAHVYKLSHRAITLILRDELKWRRLDQKTRNN